MGEGYAYSADPTPAAPQQYSDGASGWLYHTFNRRLDAQHKKEAAAEGEEYPRHPGHETCESCHQREALVRKGSELDGIDGQALSQAYEEGEAELWKMVERMFENVGLGRDQTAPEDDGDDAGMDGVEMDGDEDGDVGGSDNDEEELEFLSDPNADVRSAQAPIRRATDRAKIEKCDGIRDIVFSGTVRILLLSLDFRKVADFRI